MFNILLALIFFRPFISSLSYPQLDRYYSIFLIILSLSIILSKKGGNKNLPGQGYLALFFLVVIISSLLSFNPYKSLQALPRYLSYLFIFYLTYSLSKTDKKRLVLAIILAASGCCLYAIYWFYIGSTYLLQYMQEQQIAYPFAQEFLARRRAFMPFVLPSMLGGYLIMMLPLSCAYLLQEIKDAPGLNSKSVLLILVNLLLAFVLLLTKSLGAFLSIFLALLLFIALNRRFNKRSLLLLLLLSVLVVLAFIGRGYNAVYFTTPLFSIQKRLSYWQDILAVIRQHPFRGLGLGNLPFIQSQFTHNCYLQIWAELGLLGIFSFLGFVSGSFKVIQSRILKADKLYAGCIIAYLGFLIHNLVDFTFFLPEVALFWWIILALSLAGHKEYLLGTTQ